MSKHSSRRSFLKSTLLGSSAFSGSLPWLLRSLPPVSAQEASEPRKLVQLDDSVEPLVRLIESTPRDQVLLEVANRIHQGASYREVLAALLLAGIRNVQPQPAVGFKFHCVLVVNSCHLASVAGPDEDRWLPLFWGIDYFKSSQADEAQRSGWRMRPVDESRVPAASAARQQFLKAMDSWDVELADVATAGIVRSLGATEVFNLFARYAARDYRSIGHKAIFLANAWRTLQVIGWEFAEPVMRSLAFALLNHNGEPNPSTNDLMPDRSWRHNSGLAGSLPDSWLDGTLDPAAPDTLLQVFRADSAEAASQSASDMIVRGTSPQSIWDGVFVGAGELLMRQPGIIGLHGLTTANAMHFLWQHASDDGLRRQLLLQACSFNPLFRESAKSRGKLADTRIDVLRENDFQQTTDSAVDEILADVSGRRVQAAQKLNGYLTAGGDPLTFIDAARRLVFVKGRDAHDYKFSSAVLEDFAHVSPHWRNAFLALSVFNLRGSGDRDNQLITKSRELLDG